MNIGNDFHPSNTIKSVLIFLLIFISFSFLYTTNLDGWLMHDDEGTDFYEAWQLQKGKHPGVDFLAEQQPLYILLGSKVIDIFGRSALQLRMLCTVQVLLGSFILALAIYIIWGPGIAILTLGLLLSQTTFCSQSRLYRPDTMMISWEMAGLGIALLAISKKKRWLWALAGSFYGIGILAKPFGVFPVLGIGLFFIDLLWRNRSSWKDAVNTIIYFVLPLTFVGLGLNVFFYLHMGFYYGEAFQQHLSLGHNITLYVRFARTIVYYVLDIIQHPVLLIAMPLWILAIKKHWSENPTLRFLIYHLPIPIIFIAMKRPLYIRYYIFLFPVFVIMSAWQIDKLFIRWGNKVQFISRFKNELYLLIIIGILALSPGFFDTIFRHEDDTLKLASLVEENSKPEDIVISDYASINFFADRDSIYEASVIAGDRVEDQLITSSMIIKRIEEHDVEMVLIHVAGGDDLPHHLFRLVDYDQLRTYLLNNFDLLTTFNRAGQLIDVYKRKDF